MTHARLKHLLTVMLLVSAPLAAAPQKPAASKTATPAVEGKVWLTPTCGCCGKWLEHMAASGFKLTKEMTPTMDTVAAHKKVPEALQSCHTAVVGPYIIEGHVPADVVRKLLKEQPKIAGLSAPGMPAGSPGMESPNARPYSIVAFRADGTTYEFAKRQP